MSFLLLHIIYQITVNSLLASNSISSNFNCEYTAAFIAMALRLLRFVVCRAISMLKRSKIQEEEQELIAWVTFSFSYLLKTQKTYKRQYIYF